MSLILGVDGILDILTGFIGGLLYPLFSVIFLVINAVQTYFYAFAGIGDASFKTTEVASEPITSGLEGGKTEQGLIYYLLQNDIVVNMLFSIMLLALFLIIIFTVMAFIKNVYAAKPKGWKDIIGSSIKGLANFVFLPVCCLLGIWLGNILLKAINGATSSGGSADMSRKLFIACAYNANEYRNTDDDKDRTNAVKAYMQGHNVSQAEAENIIPAGESNEYYANVVDQVFAETNISIYEWFTVEHYYSLFNFNYLILIVGGIFMLYVLGSLCFAMIRRMFYILVLFIISPGICAMYPLDDGKAVGSWKGEFIKQVLSAYGAVAGMNIFFSILPLINNIKVANIGWGVDEIIQIFIMVCGLLIVKELIGLISGFVGGEDALSKGSGLMKNAKSSIANNTKKVVKGAGSVVGAFSGAHAAKKGGASWWGAMRESAKGGLKSFSKSWGLDKKEYDDSKKAAAKHGKDLAAKVKGEKEAEEFAKNIKWLENAMQHAQADLEEVTSGKYQYAQRTGESNADYAKRHEKEVIDAESKYNREAASYYEALDKGPVGLRDKVYEKMAKDPNVEGNTKEQVAENIKRNREIFTNNVKYDRAQSGKREIADRLNAEEKYINTLTTPVDIDAAMERFFGKGIGAAMAAMGMDYMDSADRAKVFEMRRNGTTINADSVEIQGASDPIAARAGALAFNRNLEKEQAAIDKFDETIKSFADKLMDIASTMRDSSGSLKFDESALSAMKQAIKEGTANADVESVLNDLRKSYDAQNNAIQNQLKDFKAIKKLLEEIKKDNEK